MRVSSNLAILVYKTNPETAIFFINRQIYLKITLNPLKMNELNLPKYKLNVLICVNKRPSDAIKPSCGNNTNFTINDFKELKKWLKDSDLKSKVKLIRTHCLGICPKEGFIILIFPKQKYYHLSNLEELKEFIENKVN